jgi:YesN/AraC family two-component response regulator
VDGDPGIHETVRIILKPPLTIYIATSASAAREMLMSRALDLVLLAHPLPDGSGLDLLRFIKAHLPLIMVVMVACQGSEDLAIQAFRAGARDYLRKPIDVADLRQRVETLLTLRPGGKGQGEDPSVSREPADVYMLRLRSILRAIEYMKGHLEEDLTLSVLARAAAMSKFHFCRCFKEFTGRTVREFVGRLRVARAQELLRQSDRSITDACLDSGFNDLTHFARTFRRITGTSPSAYRKLPPADRA